MNDLSAFDLGAVDRSAQGMQVTLRIGFNARMMAVIRGAFLNGTKADLESAISLILNVSADKINDAVKNWPSEVFRKMFAWHVARGGIYHRPMVLDLLESASYVRYREALEVLK